MSLSKTTKIDSDSVFRPMAKTHKHTIVDLANIFHNFLDYTGEVTIILIYIFLLQQID